MSQITKFLRNGTFLMPASSHLQSKIAVWLIAFSLLAFTSYDLKGQVVLNEIMAENAGSVPNGADYPDWIELYNVGSFTLNLNGWTLSDGIINPLDTNAHPSTFTFTDSTL